MIITAISDLHGNLINIPKCDILLIAGDVCPTYNHNIFFQKSWLKNDFSKWLSNIDAKYIIGIAGNHDFIAEKDHSFMKELPWIYLQDENIIIDKVKIHGSPWTPQFFDWAFMKEDHELEKYWDLIDDDTDILVTHGPPRGILSIGGRNEEAGCISLMKRIKKLWNLKLHVFGHLHGSRGVYHETNNQRIFSNVTIVNEMYDPVYEPYTVDLYFEQMRVH